ncbi:hypothetical protein HanPSC8_Chr17g0792101 [Helianthus annuus]|nr:hypothetical protein HanPSC8_Chr17g0792101 [Helianthus annuus]
MGVCPVLPIFPFCCCVLFVSLYVVAFEREGGRMATIAKKPDEELWYHRIVKNFVLPRDADLSFQPAAGAGCILRFVSRRSV